MCVSIDKSTVHRVVHCKVHTQYVLMRNGAPLLELSSYPFSKYMKFVADVDLASSLLHKSRREIRKNKVQQTDRRCRVQSDKQNPEVTN